MPKYTKYTPQLMLNVKGYAKNRRGSVYDWISTLDLDNITEQQKQTALEVANMTSVIKANRAIYNDKVYKVYFYPKYWGKIDGKWQFLKSRKDIQLINSYNEQHPRIKR